MSAGDTERATDTGAGVPVLAACACFNARSAARAITDLYDRALEPSGVRLTQFAILAVIQARAAASMQTIAAELGLDPSTMTRTTRPLEDAGLVESRAGGDKRARELVLTASGRKKAGECHALWADAQRELRQKLGAEVFDRLVSDLGSVTRALR
jgi:DNA-binding MarR family transcriptional regulator